MPKFAEIQISTNQVRRVFSQDEQPPDIPRKDVMFLPFVEVPKPAYDGETQNLSGPQPYAVSSTDVRQVWTVTAKTAAELDTIKDQKVGNMDGAILQIAFRHENLIRELIRALRATSTAANNAANSAILQVCQRPQTLAM
jgi:hypothetical protein